MNSDLLWLVMLTLAAGPAAGTADPPAQAANVSSDREKVERANGNGLAANAEASAHRGARKTGHAVKTPGKKLENRSTEHP